MACRQGALGSPVQLRRSADGDRGLPGSRRRGPPPPYDGSGDRRLPPGRVDEPRGTRAAVPTPGRSESRVARRLSKGLKSGDFLPRAAGLADDRDHGLQKVEMRVGMIVDVQDFPEARNPSYKLRVDFGPFGIKRSSAAVQQWYSKPELLGRRVIALTNFPLRQIGPLLSEVLCLGAVSTDGPVV